MVDERQIEVNQAAVRRALTRSFTSFSQAAEENGQSRIYLGIHWAFDKTAGIKQGNAIANYAFDHYLEPLRSHGGGRGPHGGEVVRLTLPVTSSGHGATKDADKASKQKSVAQDVL